MVASFKWHPGIAGPWHSVDASAELTPTRWRQLQSDTAVLIKVLNEADKELKNERREKAELGTRLVEEMDAWDDARESLLKENHALQATLAHDSTHHDTEHLTTTTLTPSHQSQKKIQKMKSEEISTIVLLRQENQDFKSQISLLVEEMLFKVKRKRKRKTTPTPAGPKKKPPLKSALLYVNSDILPDRDPV